MMSSRATRRRGGAAAATSSQQEVAPWKLVLSCRSPSTPPSELEVLLRPRCHKIKVVEKLNGAHILVPLTFVSSGNNNNNQKASVSKSLAIRYYSTEDLRRLSSSIPSEDNGINVNNKVMDGLKEFTASFALILIFFVLPDQGQAFTMQGGSKLHEELDNNQSFTRTAMNLLTSINDDEVSSKAGRVCRLLVVPNTELALEGILTFSNALQPEREALKQAYFQRQRLFRGLGPLGEAQGGSHDNNGQLEQRRAMHLSHQVRQTFATWARRFELPEAEEDVLMEFMGSLEAISTMINHGTVPIEDRTRILLSSFFDQEDFGRSTPKQPTSVSDEGNESYLVLPLPHHEQTDVMSMKHEYRFEGQFRPRSSSENNNQEYQGLKFSGVEGDGMMYEPQVEEPHDGMHLPFSNHPGSNTINNNNNMYQPLQQPPNHGFQAVPSLFYTQQLPRSDDTMMIPGASFYSQQPLPPSKNAFNATMMPTSFHHGPYSRGPKTCQHASPATLYRRLDVAPLSHVVGPPLPRSYQMGVMMTTERGHPSSSFSSGIPLGPCAQQRYHPHSYRQDSLSPFTPSTELPNQRSFNIRGWM